MSAISNYKITDSYTTPEYMFLTKGKSYHILTGISGTTGVFTDITPTRPMKLRRVVKSVTWEAPVTDNHTISDTPANPGNYDTSAHTYTDTSGTGSTTVTYHLWWCTSMRYTKGYGSPLTGRLSETWNYKQPYWEFEE